VGTCGHTRNKENRRALYRDLTNMKC
jgi:hypothetical protein